MGLHAGLMPLGRGPDALLGSSPPNSFGYELARFMQGSMAQVCVGGRDPNVRLYICMPVFMQGSLHDTCVWQGGDVGTHAGSHAGKPANFMQGSMHTSCMALGTCVHDSWYRCRDLAGLLGTNHAGLVTQVQGRHTQAAHTRRPLEHMSICKLLTGHTGFNLFVFDGRACLLACVSSVLTHSHLPAFATLILQTLP